MFATIVSILCCSPLLAGAYLITNNASDMVNRAFSYIVVGGGTAGLTIANRLTENENVTVLVIEAGDDLRNDVRVTDPGNAIASIDANLTWEYLTTNQTVGGKALSFTVGKALGGSSTINGMQWTRGTISQYDAIEELGNPGWNFNSFQSYMKKAEAFRAPNPAQIALGVAFNPSAHGRSGQVVTGFPNPYPCPQCKLWDAFINSTASVFPGLRTTNIDQCTGDPRGVARCSYSIIPSPSTGPNAGQNIRSSSAQSYIYSLAPYARTNLCILVAHQATKIIWDTTGGRLPKPRGVAIQAIGSPSTSFMVSAIKEVVVSSGALGSPKFLELSGIGNKNILKSFGIPVVVNLPAVGTNLQDQPLISSAFSSSIQLNSSLPHASPTGTAAFITLAQLLGVEGSKRFLQELSITQKQRASEIVAAGAGISEVGVHKMLQIQSKQFGEQEAPVAEYILTVFPAQELLISAGWALLPQYRGTVHITSGDPAVPPAINPNYLTTSLDFSLLVNVSVLARRIFNEPALKSFSSAELSPGLSVQTPEQFSDFVTNNYMATLHPIGTVPMLPHELGGAVDSQLRVYGVQGVRVADASIIPLQLSAHLSSTVYGIGEKAADLIKGIIF